ncbi:MAG: VOC family protein [Gemmatimonadota bacterium]
MVNQTATGLDHVVIFTPELDSGAEIYRRLGFHLTTRGRHSHLGTANQCIILERDYIELLTIVVPGPANERWRPIFRRGGGLGAMVFACEDARAVHAALVARGVQADDPMDFGRPVPLPGGTVEARFSVCLLPKETSPAIAAFFCEQLTREYVWRPEWQVHPNGATGVAGLTIVTPSPAELAPAYQALLGDSAVEKRRGRVTLTLGGARVWIITPAEAERRLGSAVDALLGEPRPIGLTITVRDLAATKAHLDSREVAYVPFGRQSIRVAPGSTHGIHLEFLQPDPA